MLRTNKKNPVIYVYLHSDRQCNSAIRIECLITSTCKTKVEVGMLTNLLHSISGERPGRNDKTLEVLAMNLEGYFSQ